MKHKKKLIISGVFFILLLVVVFGSLKQSPIDNFPVPIIAQIEKKYPDDAITYRFNGINQLYVQHVKVFGWKEVDRMGSQGIFEKDGKRVSLTTDNDTFHIAVVE
ncbi:hypothetical protein [Metabacillus fastidiosus]|uniref:hypothetical protein n=1 Tax=Metabacillus fastidiosus TaxID=1458 RepID=UPI002DBE8E6C|nr:hypothetical protein [Metabacillus fastidiosus]MEC2077184.1 hypothetical protein [Metabacillus fastidiosus]